MIQVVVIYAIMIQVVGCYYDPSCCYLVPLLDPPAWQFIRTQERVVLTMEQLVNLRAKGGPRAVIKLMDDKKHM
jgi:hypothetical protein